MAFSHTFIAHVLSVLNPRVVSIRCRYDSFGPYLLDSSCTRCV
jgi:hypothetical protein